MIGTIHIKDLKVDCIVGILPDERINEQRVSLDLELDCDFEEAARTQEVGHTVNYAEVCEVMTEWVRQRKFLLIEALAEEGCHLIFERWPSVKRCRLMIRKPSALKRASYAAVSVERSATSAA